MQATREKATGTSIFRRNNVNVFGTGPKTMMLAHGYGCDQQMWRFVAAAFAEEYRVILFDHVGAGKSELGQYSVERYRGLDGYAEDVLEVIEATGGDPVVFVGHSVSATIGILAAVRRPEWFERLVLIGPSPRYINDGDYFGGFSRGDIDGLLETLDSNYLGWSSTMAPVIMGNAERPQLAAELNESFCRTDPAIAKRFARATFLADNRRDFSMVQTSALILQCADDAIAPRAVGEYVNRQLRNSTLVYLRATGHCPHLSAPEETIEAIRRYLNAM